MKSMNATIFDALMELAAELNDALVPKGPRRLTPSRILVLALMSVSPDRAHIRHMAHAVSEASTYESDICRVHDRRQLLRILTDLHAMGLLDREMTPTGAYRFSLTRRARKCMRSYLRRARVLAYRNTSQ